MVDDLALEILDSDWDRLFITPQVQRASITDELGGVGEAEVTIPLDDQAILYLPDPQSVQSNEGRWRLYEGSTIKFAGVVDQTTRQINEDNTYSFGGKQRGILLGQANVGRRDFNAWPLEKLFTELLWDNVAKAPLASIEEVAATHKLHPAVNAIIGDQVENNYWAAAISGTNQMFKIDLGQQTDIEGIRIVPPWWDDRYYNFDVETSPDDTTYTPKGSYTSPLPLGDKGYLFITSGTTARYVAITMGDSSDLIPRLAFVAVYRAMGTVGNDTDYIVPWIENDDSGNLTKTGTWVSMVENGAFNGDGVLGNSFVTRMSGSSTVSHRFKGTSNGVYFTQGTKGGLAAVSIYLDNVFQETVAIPASTYQHKAYEITGLSNGFHHLKVQQLSGTPQLDYFQGLYETSYRKIKDDDPSLGYEGSWSYAEGDNYSNFRTARSDTTNSNFYYQFIGDSIKVYGTKGPGFGIAEFFIDGGSEGTVDCYNASQIYQQLLLTWSGSYATHNVRAKVTGAANGSATGHRLDIDHIEGNLAHIIYLRSFYENNLRLLTRLSEITNSFLRFNHDGTIDLLGQIGTWSQTIVREGENEGGTIINASAQSDYSETASAVLALVTGPDDLPIKAFVIDRNAVARMGLKIRKAEEADANDAYLLTRQAWQELQDHVQPEKRFTVEYDPIEVGDIEVGETTILHSDRLGLTAGDEFRVGRMTTEYDVEA